MSFFDETLDDLQGERFVNSVTNVLTQVSFGFFYNFYLFFIKISDIWQQNVPKMISDQQRCASLCNKFKERHRHDLKTIENLKSTLAELQTKLNAAENVISN